MSEFFICFCFLITPVSALLLSEQAQDHELSKHRAAQCHEQPGKSHSLHAACLSRAAAPQLISIHRRGWGLLPLWLHIYPPWIPQLQQDPAASTACKSQSSPADNFVIPLSSGREALLSDWQGLGQWHSALQIVTPLFCLYAQSYIGKPRNFANSAPALQALQSSVNTSSQRRNPSARRGREKYVLNTFSENYLNTSSIKWQTKSEILFIIPLCFGCSERLVDGRKLKSYFIFPPACLCYAVANGVLVSVHSRTEPRQCGSNKETPFYFLGATAKPEGEDWRLPSAIGYCTHFSGS